MAGVSKPTTISTKQARIAELARQMPDRSLHSLSRHIDLEWMREAHRRTRKDGAVGVDGQTAAEFAEHLEENLQKLVDEAKSGTYRAPPVRRVLIPKGDGTKTRPIGIPTFADKVLQRAVAMLLEPVYEQVFVDFSYGFRPGRSPHDALDDLQRTFWGMGGGWLLEADLSSFFDTLDHKVLRDMLRQRVTDGVVVRLVGKWLRAGVLDGGVVTRQRTGTPQGGVISPLLANIYLHEVIDTWWVRDVQPRLRGQAHLVRFADDFVVMFANREDAHRVQAVLPKRCARYGLTLHPDKTRLVRFRKPPRKMLPPEEWKSIRPDTFDFLGFTHYWGRSRKGKWALKRKTAKDRLRRAAKKVALHCRRTRHLPLWTQAQTLREKLRGHYQYYGVTGNYPALRRYYRLVVQTWRKWLNRRSQRARMPWPKFDRLFARYPLCEPVVARSVYRSSANP